MQRDYLWVLPHSLEGLGVECLRGVVGDKLTSNRPQQKTSHSKASQDHQEIREVSTSLHHCVIWEGGREGRLEGERGERSGSESALKPQLALAAHLLPPQLTVSADLPPSPSSVPAAQSHACASDSWKM